MNLIKKEIAKNQTDNLHLRAELNKMKAFYDAKIKEKNQLIERQEEQETEQKEKH